VRAYDPSTALIVVDVQNDFADPDGTLHVAGADAVIRAVNREIGAAIAGGAFVVATQDWHPERTPHFVTDGGPWPVHCVGGTWGADLHPFLEFPDEAPRVRKGANGEDGYSGFTMRHPATGETQSTELEALLRDGRIERVAVVGLATDYCVKETALDAARLGFETVIVDDAIAAVDIEPGDGDRALDDMQAAGVRIEAPTAAPGSSDATHSA
jgi:nicotinamidase/pyrazinamidase